MFYSSPMKDHAKGYRNVLICLLLALLEIIKEERIKPVTLIKDKNGILYIIMYVVHVYSISFFDILFTYNKNLLSPQKNNELQENRCKNDHNKQQ